MPSFDATLKSSDVITGVLHNPTLQGDSAYTVAVQNGYEGSEEEWIASLKGDTGNGISSISLNPDYTLTITTTDGDSTTVGPIRGEQGIQGIQGVKGDTGNGISTISYDSNGYLEIITTDGSNYRYYMKGDKGDKGNKGTSIYNIEKTGTSGLIDTYTIFLDDGTTTTFDVKNGQDVIVEESVDTESDYRLRFTDVNGSIETPNLVPQASEVARIDNVASQALSTANNVETHMTSLDTQVKALEDAMNNISIDADDLGLYQDADTHYVYPTYKNVVSENGIPLAGGGGSGGGDVVSAVLTVENTTGWLSKTLSQGSDCVVSFTWSSIEDDMPTGDGNVRVIVNDVVCSSSQISQGNVSVNIGNYLAVGTNKVKVRISDTYDQGRTTTFNITVIALSISSTFDYKTVYNSSITVPVTPIGSVSKAIKGYVDGNLAFSDTTSVSGRQLSFTIPAQTHGSHSLRIYFDAEVNGETVRSNELYYEFMSVETGNNTVIISSTYNKVTEEQYSSITIPYQVYDPTNLTAEVKIYANNVEVAKLTVDRNEQTYVYRAMDVGTLNIKIASGTTEITRTITITESDVDAEAVTQDLVLHLTSQGRSNAEGNPWTWTYGNIDAVMTGFNGTSDGWQIDKDGTTCLRVAGDARVVIPYKPFATDFRATGKTIEVEFATRNVLNYDSVIMSCMSGGRGFELTAQKAFIASEQSSISTQYKEDEHTRIAFVVEKRAENRLLYIYINGIASGAVQYPVDDDFSQVNPVNISIGSNDCTIDIYNIRVYDNNLNRFQIVENWIADTQDGTLMLDRYTRNNVYNAYGQIVISQLPSYLPYMIVSCPELPQYKGDKKTCNGQFVNPLYPSKSFEFTGAQFDVQGTSSQYYPRKNYKAKFKNGFIMNNGSTSKKYALNDDSIPTSTFCFKADVASSEGANNVELARLYNDSCPYKTPAQVSDSKVRQGIDGFPMLIFWNDTANNTTSFIGKYNFNHDKGTSEVFGFASPDESWETLNNTSDRVIWKSADYSGTAWLNDFEARYPDTDPAYTNPAQLYEFATWVVSTDTTAATNETLRSPVTYDGVTYTTDSAEYRLAKFKAEAGNYMEIESALFYYLFTELFLMVDSRAKNAFPSFIGSEV